MGRIEFRKDVISLLGDALGIFLASMVNYRDTGKFLEIHYGGHFLDIFSPALQVLRDGGLEPWVEGPGVLPGLQLSSIL